MTTTNCRVRFSENNFAELTSNTATYSSALAAYPGSNVINKFRSLIWKPSGYFKITAGSNDILYINDGSDKDVTITAGEYTTPALLATQIQTDLNAASSNWTVSYSTSTYKFTLANTATIVLRLSEDTTPIWDTIGFTTSANRSGTSLLADQQRNHTEEFAIFDLGYNYEPTFFACISPLSEVFSTSRTGTISIQANNINSWDSPPFDVTLSRTDDGVFKFFDDQTSTGYRYWKFKIVDKLNTGGPEGLSFGHLYIGDYITLDDRNIGNGIQFDLIDPSERLTSENGAIYFNTRTKYYRISSASIKYLNETDRVTIKNMFNKLGMTTPFYISVDPREGISSDQEMTKYVIFDDQPTFNHIISSIFNFSFSVREVV